MNIRSCANLIAVIAAFTSGSLNAEQLYVADKLVLNVYAEADQGSSRVATIETGDAVEEIERSENFIHVRMPDGREGWVGANYLSTQPPAIVRLKELQAAQPAAAPAQPPKELTDEIARLRKQNAALASEVAEAKKKSTAAPPSVTSAPAVHEVLPPPPTSDATEEPQSAPVVVVQRSYWWAWMLAVLAAGAAGFVVGYRTLGRRVRERFGGVKVY